MAKLTYIKVFVDYLEALEPLGDAERGRLFTSLLTYARTGEAPQLNGNERFIFPMMRANIDRDVAGMDEITAIRSEAEKKALKQNEQMQAKRANASKCSKREQKLQRRRKRQRQRKRRYSFPLTPFRAGNTAGVGRVQGRTAGAV